MRVLSLVGVAALALLVSSCGNKPKDLIVGKWESTEEPKEVVEYGKDGTAKTTVGPLTMTATYKFIDDNTMELEVDNPLAGGGVVGVDVGPKKLKIQTKVTVTKDELTITGKDKDGKEKTTKYKRVK